MHPSWVNVGLMLALQSADQSSPTLSVITGTSQSCSLLYQLLWASCMIAGGCDIGWTSQSSSYFALPAIVGATACCVPWQWWHLITHTYTHHVCA
jgi:hypothetical protein